MGKGIAIYKKVGILSLFAGENMEEIDEWKLVRWYCPNCGRICKSYINKNGVAKSLCRVCEYYMISVKKSPDKNILTITK